MNSFSYYLGPVSSFIIATMLIVLCLLLLIFQSRIHKELKTVLYIGVCKLVFLSLIFVDMGLTDLQINNGIGFLLYPTYGVLQLLFIIKFLQYITARPQWREE